MTKNNNHHTCEICHKNFTDSQLFPIKLLRNSVLESTVHDYPEIDLQGYICHTDLKKVRTDHIEKILIQDRGALSELDQEVLRSLEKQDILVENINKKFEHDLAFGERVADKVALFGGSWKFVLSFLGLIIFWMIINTFFFYSKSFDPYPFILLNLVLSCLAALQAPVIMMSQNRQAEKEHLRANEDYLTNLKAELEIQQLHSKLDLFMKRQWETLIELQKIQIELVEDVLHNKSKKKES